MTVNGFELNVLHITGAPAGGIRKHIHAILLGLPEVRQSYACCARDGDAAFKEEFPAVAKAVGGRVLDLVVSKRPAFTDITNILLLRKFVKANNITIVHGHGAKGGLYSRVLTLLCGVKAVYTPHGGAMHAMFSPPEDMVYRLVERLLLPWTDYFVFESGYTAAAFERRVGRRPACSVVNYSGIDVPEPGVVAGEAGKLGYTAPPHELPAVGVFGILRPQKGQQLALEAAANLKKSGLRVKLHFFGDGPDREKLARRSAALGISEDVQFHGEVECAAPHMWGMDAVLIPSLFESFGYVALEAMALKVPVAAADTGGLKEIILNDENGSLFEAGNAAALADSLARLFADRQAAARRAANGFMRVRTVFSREKMLSGLLGIYRGLAGAVPL
jgi:glycosyltransferase involved in cell wall biosynthesis